MGARPNNFTSYPLFEMIQPNSQYLPALYLPGDAYKFVIVFTHISGDLYQASFQLDTATVPQEPWTGGGTPHAAQQSCGTIPSGFTCDNGVLKSSSSIDRGTAPFAIGTVPVVISGNLTVGSLVFTNPGTTLTIEGCLNITQGSGVTLDLTGKSSLKGASITLITQSSSCSNAINTLPVSITQSKKTCQKGEFKPASPSTYTLAGAFTINHSPCDNKWIILGSVLGGVAVLTVIIIIVACTVLKSKSASSSRRALKV